MPTTRGTRKGNGVGKGAGWGGPAKGAGIVAERAPLFEPRNAAAAGPHDMTDMQRAKALRDHLYTLALNAERQETQLSASVALLNRIEGTPIARNINVSADDISALDDDSLAQRRAEVARALVAAGHGAAAPGKSH